MLEREVQIFADFFLLPDQADEFGGNVGRMGVKETDPPQPLYLYQPSQQPY